MRAHRGWIVAMLLAALAFAGGPELLDTTLAPAQTPAASRQADHLARAAGQTTRPGGHHVLTADRSARPTGLGAQSGGHHVQTAGQATRSGGHRVLSADQGTPRRQWVPALPVSSSQGHAPAPVRLSAGPARPQSMPPSGVRGERSRPGGPCSPETLQTFRC